MDHRSHRGTSTSASAGTLLPARRRRLLTSILCHQGLVLLHSFGQELMQLLSVVLQLALVVLEQVARHILLILLHVEEQRERPLQCAPRSEDAVRGDFRKVELQPRQTNFLRVHAGFLLHGVAEMRRGAVRGAEILQIVAVKVVLVSRPRLECLDPLPLLRLALLHIIHLTIDSIVVVVTAPVPVAFGIGSGGRSRGFFQRSLAPALEDVALVE